MCLFVLFLLLGGASVAEAQDWGRLSLPGSVRAARVVADVGASPGRSDAYFLLDFVQRVHGGPDRTEAVETFLDYLAWHEAMAGALRSRPGGFRMPGRDAPGRERDQGDAFLELLGLRVGRGGLVEAASSARAIERHAWLAALETPVTGLLERLASDDPIVLAFGSSNLPLPLPGIWSSLAGRRPVLEAIIHERDLALLYAGLLGTSPELRAVLGTDSELLRRVRQSAGVFAAFGRSLSIRDGRVDLPGGDEAGALWERLVGASVSDPRRFVERLLGADDGRLAYFLDTIVHVSTPVQRRLLHLHRAERDRRRALERTYQIFVDVDAQWRVRDRPFVRPKFDPALVLAVLPAPDTGRLAPPWWPSLLQRIGDSGDWPRSADATLRALSERESDVGWLLEWVFEKPAEATTRFRMFRFAVRMAATAPLDAAGDLELATRAVRDVPSVAFALERMGVRDLALVARVARAARQFGSPGDEEGLGRLVRWQALLALVEQAHLRVRFPEETLEVLLDGLISHAAERGRRADGWAAAWLVETLLPAVKLVGDDPEIDGVERLVVQRITERPRHAVVPVFWEGLDYVLDDSWAAARDALDIRTARPVPLLDDVLRLHAVRRSIETGGNGPLDVQAFVAHVAQATAAMELLPQPGSVEPLAVTEFRRVARRLSRVQSIDQIRRSRGDLPEIRFALDALIDGVVIPLVYALAVSPTGSVAATFADVAWQHRWQTGGGPNEPATFVAWQPATISYDMQGGRAIIGSLLGLDLAIGDARLRQAARLAPPERPARISDSEREALLRAMRILQESFSLSEADAESVWEAVDAGRARRAAWTTPSEAEAAMRTAGIDARRASLAAWWVMEGGDASLVLRRIDDYHLGTAAELAGALGPQGVQADGGWVSLSGGALARFEWDGRAGAGLSVVAGTEVAIALLEAVHARGLPAAIVPALLSVALNDLLGEVRQFDVDDLRVVSDWSRTITDDLVDGYLLHLVASRILAPPREGGRRP